MLCIAPLLGCWAQQDYRCMAVSAAACAPASWPNGFVPDIASCTSNACEKSRRTGTFFWPGSSPSSLLWLATYQLAIFWPGIHHTSLRGAVHCQWCLVALLPSPALVFCNTHTIICTTLATWCSLHQLQPELPALQGIIACVQVHSAMSCWG